MENVFVAINNIVNPIYVSLKSIYETKGSDGETYNCKNGGDAYYCFVFVSKGKITLHTSKNLKINLQEKEAILVSSNDVKSYVLQGEDIHYFWVYFSYSGNPLPVNIPFEIKDPDAASISFAECSKLLNQQNEYSLMNANMIFTNHFLLGVKELSHRNKSGSTINIKIMNSVEYINENLFHLPAIEEIAGMFGLSLKKYREQFEKTIGISPSKYVREKKLSVAKGYLDNTDLTLEEIAKLLEFSSPYYLSRIFKQRYGFPPKEYRSKRNN